jgi:hypothetical protein
VEAYAEGEPARVAAVMDWLPFVAAARLSEGVPDERDRLLRLIEGPASAQG